MLKVHLIAKGSSNYVKNSCIYVRLYIM